MRPPEFLSPCMCQKEQWDDFLICMHAKKWLTLIEIKTDTPVDYKKSQDVYERVQLKSGNADEELQILRDSHRTFPDEPFFSQKDGEGQ